MSAETASGETPADAKTKVVTPRNGVNPAEREVAEKLVGTRLGDYEVLELLGIGGMGAVYRAKKLSLDRTVALKVLRRNTDSDSAARFVREAQLAAQLEHTNVVTIYHVGEADGQSFIEMQYVKGRSVYDVIASGQPIPLRDAVRIVRQAAEGMVAAHEMGIIHRDVKPSNIIIDGAGVVKVADFGLAKRLEADTSLTMPEVLVGTPEYMAPEQWEAGSADARTDVYALGVTAYYLVTGRKPFAGHTPATLMRQHLEGSFPPVRKLNPNVPSAVCNVIHRMMARDPEKRYQSAADLAADLRNLEGSDELASAGDTSVVARPDQDTPATYVPGARSKGASSPRLWAGLGIAALVLLAVVLAVVSRPSSSGTPDQQPGGLPVRPGGVTAGDPSSPGPDARAEFQRGLRLLRKEQAAEARKVLSALLKLSTTEGTSLGLWGLALLSRQLDKNDEALGLLDRLKALNPTDPAPHVLAAEILLRQKGDEKRAREELAIAVGKGLLPGEAGEEFERKILWAVDEFLREHQSWQQECRAIMRELLKIESWERELDEVRKANGLIDKQIDDLGDSISEKKKGEGAAKD